MKNFRRTKKRLIKEEPIVCSDGSVQWGDFNIKFDVAPDVGWDGVDWGSGSYGCSISWMIAPPTTPGKGPRGMMWRGQKKVYDIESAYNHLVTAMGVPEETAISTVNELAPIIMGMRSGEPIPDPTPTYPNPWKGLGEGRRYSNIINENKVCRCMGQTWYGHDGGIMCNTASHGVQAWYAEDCCNKTMETPEGCWVSDNVRNPGGGRDVKDIRRVDESLINEEKCGGGGPGGYDKYTFSWKIHPDSGGSIKGMGGLYFTCSLTISFMVAPPTGGGSEGGLLELEQVMQDQGIPTGQIGSIISKLETQADRNGSSSVTLSQNPMSQSQMGGCPMVCPEGQVPNASCSECVGGENMDYSREPLPSDWPGPGPGPTYPGDPRPY